MADKQTTDEAGDFPRGMGNPARQALALAGYTRLEHLSGVSRKELLRLHGVGKKALQVAQEALEARGMSLAE